MRRYSLLFCLIFALLFIMMLPSYALDISAKGAVLLEAQSQEVAFEKNMDLRLPMASTTKIMTALVVLENSCPDDVVTITEEMTGIEGSSIYLKPGEKLTVSELLYALMLESANDASVALAIHVAGSVDSFAEMMNERARAMGLTETSFSNPHGLDNENHYTTPYELGIIALNAMKNKYFFDIVSTRKIIIQRHNEDSARLLVNHNKLLRIYDGAVGIKTGFTKRCGRCLVSCAERDGVMLIAVTLNAPNDWNDHKAMLDYGFSLYENVKLAQAGDYKVQLHAVNGVNSQFIAENTQDASVILRKNNINISAVLEASRILSAPIKKGQEVGKIVFYNNDEPIYTLPLYSTCDINNIEYKKSILERLLK